MVEQEESASLSDGAIVIGTYDGGLLGFSAVDGVQKFGYAPHTGCVKTLHCSQAGRLASGGTDHMVRLFNLSRGVELGELQEHQDTVTCLKFVGASTLITASEDGQVCIWQCANWDLLLKFRAHKVAVTCLAVHPSGRLMASAGKDKGVRLWDLMRGTSAADLSTADVVQALEWSPSGEHLAVLSEVELILVNSQTDAVATYREPGSAGIMRVTLSAAMFLTDTAVLLGDGRGALRIMGCAKEGGDVVEICQVSPGSARGRVKAMSRAGDMFALGTSTGSVEVWQVATSAWGTRAAQTSDFSQLRVVDTGARLTCLTMWRSSAASIEAVEESNEVAGKTESIRKKKRRKGAKV